jgi:hypothetical protein
VLPFEHFVDLVGMALFTGFFARKTRFARLQLHQGIAAKPPVLPERSRSQKITGYRIRGNDPDGQKKQPQDLRWHFKEWAHELSRVYKLTSPISAFTPAAVRRCRQSCFPSVAVLLAFFAVPLARNSLPHH